MKKRRADETLFEQMNLETIELARALIMEGRVMAGDRKILRASEMLRPDERLRVRAGAPVRVLVMRDIGLRPYRESRNDGG